MIKARHKVNKINTIIILFARTSFFNALLIIFFIMIINSKTDFTLKVRIRIIDFSFFIMISIIRIIITINNNNNSYKLFKNKNVRYLTFVNLYKSLMET